ncbi:hypothetical protein HHL28_10500 [Aerophototrophica crusticola]|uniref:Uncharacterized protein n=1 Tax=Aerophototrophica crusticola TaxID=1709002 RepID=A0A858R7R8_9PROT|nr:hypothetical protein HHL28_10500 [Rhodospirillaceae bacterium B3]
MTRALIPYRAPDPPAVPEPPEPRALALLPTPPDRAAHARACAAYRLRMLNEDLRRGEVA